MEKKNLVIDVNENPKRLRDWFLFSIQHILAMLVACITVPLITGLPIGATLIAAGIGTLFYIFATKKKSPVFLSSSFAYIAPMQSALLLGTTYPKWDKLAAQFVSSGNANYLAVIIGMAFVGLIYVLISVIIKFLGTKWINKLLPPVVIGPIIMCIGLSLAGSAINNVSSLAIEEGSVYMSIFIALVGMVATALASHYGKKTIQLIPFVIGMGSAYLLAVVSTLIGNALDVNALKVINFTPLTSFDWGNIKSYFTSDFMFTLAANQSIKIDGALLASIAVLFVPVAFVTVCEHIGDHKNLGNIIDKDLLNDEPGITRTLIGDGVATALSGGICGAANTTYGENVAVIGVSKIASVNVIIVASIMAIIFGFFAPLTALLQTIPSCITGGISLILYGFIASSGVNLIIKEKVDFSKTKNIIVASIILISGIGGFSITIGKVTITPIAMAMILGIIMNSILREKKEEIQ